MHAGILPRKSEEAFAFSVKHYCLLHFAENLYFLVRVIAGR